MKMIRHALPTGIDRANYPLTSTQHARVLKKHNILYLCTLTHAHTRTQTYIYILKLRTTRE